VHSLSSDSLTSFFLGEISRMLTVQPGLQSNAFANGYAA
jgi:hypothetical protein